MRHKSKRDGQAGTGGGGGRQACTEGGEAAWKGGEIDRFSEQERQPGQAGRHITVL